MTPEANRDPSNLLILCLFHSRAIDAQPECYPVELLLQWKKNQTGQGHGTQITDEQAAEVIAASRWSEISISAQVINVGGSWGGGGGAIGRDAVGGPGGDRVVLALNGLAPGGGGGALVGPGKTPPDAKRARDGRGHSTGLDGGETSFGGKPGRPLASARGGATGGSPYEIRKFSDALRVSTLMICNAVDVRDGLLFVLGGAWQSFSILNVPEELTIVVAMVIEAGAVRADHYSVKVAATAPDGTQVGEQTFPVVVEKAGDILRITRSVPLRMRIDMFGLHTITVSSGKFELGAIDVAVKRATDSD
jgi:hypothetical protein